MRVALGIAVPLAAALLQGSIVPFIAIADARPNLVVLVAASWAVAVGAREAIWWAFVGGLAADFLSGGPLGALALASLVPVAAVGLADVHLRPRSVPAGALLVALATLASGALYLVLAGAAGVTLGDPGPRLAAVIGTGLYNGALAVATYPMCRALRRTTEKQASFGW